MKRKQVNETITRIENEFWTALRMADAFKDAATLDLEKKHSPGTPFYQVVHRDIVRRFNANRTLARKQYEQALEEVLPYIHQPLGSHAAWPLKKLRCIRNRAAARVLRLGLRLTGKKSRTRTLT